MQKYIIGIDTGGTFTDAVIINNTDGKIIDIAKSPTTHHNLAEGTGNAIKLLLAKGDILPEAIEAVAVSSTLATNSVVENKGARVGLFVIGYVKHFNLPVQSVDYIKGGHTVKGEEEEPLDLEHLLGLVTGLKDEVDAYGICGSMSMKNPTHELVAEKAISLVDPKPVFCSHRISQQAGMQERAATAALHAKLMPIMKEYIGGVVDALEELEIVCPMIVISGNGQPITTKEAVKQAGLTVASGPACTAFFGSQQALQECLVIDIGGTTTDIAMVEKGQPLLSSEGTTIGEWKTQVEAVDMLTQGIGGDSHVQVDAKGKISLGPNRVDSLSVSQLLIPVDRWIGHSTQSKCICLRENTCQRQDKDPILKFLHNNGPATPHTIRKKTGLGGIPLDRKLERMSHRQLLFETGFTPTDALVVLQETDIGDREKALTGATVLGRLLEMDPVTFSKEVVRLTEEKIENCILEYVIQRYWGKSVSSFVATSRNHPVLGMGFSLNIPLVGVGAAASYFLRNIAENLSTTVVFPDNYEVGNAVGAARICLTGGEYLQKLS